MSSFPTTRYEDWIQQLEKDLKGKPWTDLQWQLGEDLVLDPFYHPDQYFPQRLPLHQTGPGQRWEIGETIPVLGDLKAANRVILEALEGGVEALELIIQQGLNATDWAQLLAEVQLSYLSLHLQLAMEPSVQLTTLQHFESYGQQIGLSLKELRGSIATPTSALLVPEVQTWALEHLPGLASIVVDGCAEHRGSDSCVQELVGLLSQAEGVLHTFTAQGRSGAELAAHLMIKVAISPSFFVEIAKLRALRILWSNVLKAYELSESELPLAVYFAPTAQDDNPNTNLIRAATMAMAAILGGAQLLVVLPANVGKGEQPNTFTRRMARNVQHLLRLESHLDKVQDPAAGSYYIEKLTEELAQKAWERFQLG